MSELDDIKAASEENHKKEPMMESACWEYACYCHDMLPRAIAIAEETVWHTGLTRSFGVKVAEQLQQERDEARAEVDALKVKLAAAGVVIEDQADELGSLGGGGRGRDGSLEDA